MARGKNPKSLANLKPAKKGEVRNPEGINRRPMTDEYYADLQEAMPDNLCKKLGLPPGTLFAKGHARARNLDGLMQGGYLSSKEMREAIEGRAPERLEITGNTRVIYQFEVIEEDRTPPKKSNT